MGADDNKRRVLIMGAGGRDFHNFNCLYRDRQDVQVVAFTTSQIPFQENRCYPPKLSGPGYLSGIPIVPVSDLMSLIQRENINEVLFSYSDISHDELMHIASQVLAAGAAFRLAGPDETMLAARIPVISVCAVRTGCGKSPLTRYLCRLLKAHGRQPVVVRHPMAYGRLDIRAVEHFRSFDDLEVFQCTMEEREEYEPLLAMGIPLFAGIDYAAILNEAQTAGDILIWDGGNNDFSFYRPDLEIVLADALRPGHELTYYPGLVNLLRAHLVVISKAGSAPQDSVQSISENIQKNAPSATVALGSLTVSVDHPEVLKGKRVVVVEDGPTLTHGGMSGGAGLVAAQQFDAAAVVDPRPFAVGHLAEVFRQFPHLHQVIPAMGYHPQQVEDLASTINAIPADLVLSATPLDLSRLLRLNKPLVRVGYEFSELDGTAITDVLAAFLRRSGVDE